MCFSPVANILSGVAVVCDEVDLFRFDSPPNQTCGAYAGAWATGAGGYIANPDATSNCGYCQYASGDVFLEQLNAPFGFRYGAFGALLGFCVFNVFAAFALYWFFRIYGGVSFAPVIRAVKAPFQRRK